MTELLACAVILIVLRAIGVSNSPWIFILFPLILWAAIGVGIIFIAIRPRYDIRWSSCNERN